VSSPEVTVEQTDVRLALTCVVDAPAAQVFAVMTSPRGHVEIDGSGMLVAPVDAGPLTAVGDTFDMDMDRESLGDIPLGKYRVRNTVTRYVPAELFEWNVGGVDQPPFGHVYGYELLAESADRTRVTLYCDWTGVRAGRVRDRFPIVPARMLEQSLVNLSRIVSSPDSASTSLCP
jgi:hypothetical protein